MCEPEEFLDELAANEALLARVRDAVNELIQDDPDVSDEELGWAAVDLATNIIRIPDDLDLNEIGLSLREGMEAGEQ